VSVLAQAGMLKVLLDNLLSNAFQYTDSGEVNISFVDAKLVIEDTGPGIDASISSSITEPAIKGSQSSGYGFGLSIVKRLCEHQGWQFNVESNQGTRVLVAFA
jgi:signal transduction histidine kinase